jgi:Domain of unknown function DUF29
MAANSKLYDRDFYAWSREQAALLRAGQFAEADFANIAEEIESMGRSEKRELVSRLVVLLLHLAKWRLQPELRGRSWRLSVEGQRVDIAELLADNPSLRPLLADVMTQAWRRAVIEAQRETGLDASAFTGECPWTAEQALDDAFWPD